MPKFVMRDRKSLFRQFLAGMYDSVVITDPNGHILETNPRTQEHFGCAPEEIADRHISSLIPGLKPEIVQRVRRGIESGRHMMIDAKGRHKNGETFICEIAVSQIDLKEPGDMVFTIRNVEKRRKMREALRARESAFEAAHSALFACTPDGAFTDANPSFFEMFCLAGLDDARQRFFKDLMPDEPLRENFAKALEGEKSVVAIVAEESGGDNPAATVEVALSPVRDGRKIIGVAGSIAKI